MPLQRLFLQCTEQALQAAAAAAAAVDKSAADVQAIRHAWIAPQVCTKSRQTLIYRLRFGML